MYLLLIINGECEPQEIGIRDSERSLTPEGKKDIVYAADFLNKICILPEIILSSPFNRTRETGEILSANFEISPKVETVPGLIPGADSGEIVKAVKNRTQCDSEEWIGVVIHYSDSGLIVDEFLNNNGDSSFPLIPGLIIGLELDCIKKPLSAKLLFTKYPGKLTGKSTTE